MEFQSIGELAKLPLTESFSGTCPTHGESTVEIFKAQKVKEWFCTDCHHEQVLKEDDARIRRERTEAIYRAACLPEKYMGQKFTTTTPAQRDVRAQAKAFLDCLKKERHWTTLLMVGETGTGKTLLATELAEVMMSKQLLTVRYCTSSQMIAEIQESYSSEGKKIGKTQAGEILRFVSYDILILDEIDAKPSYENANVLLTEVINQRYNALRPVIAITNQPLDILHRFVGDRVNSRLHENAFICAFTWPDFRRQQVKP